MGYFLIAYAILRSIPNKLGGVVALGLSIAILLICPFMYTSKFKGFSFYPLNKLQSCIVLLTLEVLKIASHNIYPMIMGYCDEDITWQFIAIYKKCLNNLLYSSVCFNI